MAEFEDGTVTEDTGQDQDAQQPEQSAGTETEPAGNKEAGAPDDTGTGDGDPEQPDGTETESKTFTQDDVNTFLASERRKWERKAEREALEAHQRRIEALEQEKQQAPETPQEPPQVPPTRPKPTLEEVGYDQEKYLEAFADWRFEQQQAQQKATQEHERQQQALAAQRQQAHQQLQEAEKRRQAMVDSGVSKFPDFENVAYHAPIDDVTATLVINSPASAEIAYHLGKNHDVANKLNQMPPVQRAIEIGRLAATLTSAAPPTSNVPPPRKPNKGRVKATGPNMAKLAKENPKEWRRLRHEQLKKQAGG